MKRAPAMPNGPRRAFTLVELITVMAILAVLTAMVVGAARGIREGARRQATLNLFQGLKAALRNYSVAYSGKYPWKEDFGPMRDVTTTTGYNEWKVLFPSQQYPSSSWEYYEEAILYAGLMTTARGGPFARGLAGRTVAYADSGGKKFALFADGWGRPIRYAYDKNEQELTLESLGADPEDDEDNIICYVLQPSDN
jgi:prepilin-type N-terminal cleavage/methylation domain-containing protein